MANRDAPFGFKPAAHLTGGVIRKQEYAIASALATAIGFGDVVDMPSASNKRIELAVAATATRIVGTFCGCSFQDTDGNQIYRRNWPASQATLGSEDAVAYVYDDPFIIFRCQGNGTAAATDPGKTSDFTAEAVDTVSGQSRMELVIVPSGLNFYIYDFIHDPDLVETGANAQYLVLFNEHAYRNVGATSFSVGA